MYASGRLGGDDIGSANQVVDFVPQVSCNSRTFENEGRKWILEQSFMRFRVRLRHSSEVQAEGHCWMITNTRIGTLLTNRHKSEKSLVKPRVAWMHCNQHLFGTAPKGGLCHEADEATQDWKTKCV